MCTHCPLPKMSHHIHTLFIAKDKVHHVHTLFSVKGQGLQCSSFKVAGLETGILSTAT